MMTKTRIAAAACVLLLSLLVACDRTRDQASDPPIVLLLLKTSDNPFFRSIEQGVREELRKSWPEAQLIVRAGANEGDVSSQKRMLDEFHDRYVSGRERPRLAGVLLTPSGSGDQLTAEIARFNGARVPVVLLDTKIEGEALQRAGARYDSYIGSDNRQGGELAASFLTQQLKSGGRVLLLNGVQGHETAAQRRSGFLAVVNRLNSTGAHKILVEERTANWRRSEARSAVDAMLSLGRSVDGVFAANDEMALGVLEAFRQNPGAGKPTVVVGFDATDEARREVEGGTLSATIAQRPQDMGRRGLNTLVAIRARKPVQQNQVVPVELVKRGERQ